jgi:hypothetical protein
VGVERGGGARADRPQGALDAVEDRARRNETRLKDAPAAYPQRRARRDGRLYVLRGRVRCALCGRRMEGTYQRHANWYRCRFETNRGTVAATITGPPTALQIKEERIVEALIEFMGRRLFGPDRLLLLRNELAQSVADSWREHDTDLARLRVERDDIDRALYRQTLRLEEHDDPHHPVVALATRRIEELSARRTAIDDTIRTLDARRPDGTRPDEIQAMLNAIPDLRPTLRAATPDELAELFDAFDVTAIYDKPNQTLETPRHRHARTRPRRRKTPTEQHPVGDIFHSGGGIRTRDLRVMSPTISRLRWADKTATQAAADALAPTRCAGAQRDDLGRADGRELLEIQGTASGPSRREPGGRPVWRW